MNPRYRDLAALAQAAIDGRRDVSELTQPDIDLARLYAYAYRTQTVGAFHATRLALDPFSDAPAVRAAQRRLRDLQAQAMRPVPADLRAAAPTLAWYHAWSDEVLAALSGPEAPVEANEIRDRFRAVIDAIRASDGILPMRDDDLPEQASYKVPGIEVVIVPLVYGDHISWNTAFVTAASGGATTHRHALQVEIHLGYEGVHGRTLLDGRAATVTAPYAMPIPPMLDHGFDNLSGHDHFVPFVFGSRTLDGWGVFFDVEPRPSPTHDWPETPLESSGMNRSVHLEPALAALRQAPAGERRVLIDAERTARPATGGLELAAMHVGDEAMSLSFDEFHILSVREGRLKLAMAGVSIELGPRDHVGIPAGLRATLRALDGACLLLEASLQAD
ncbi:MAG: hypothetical protein OXG33_10185 [Chloroflexi bacterium]|nr:hypothetical protein [Chloroflexota bacterium]